MRTPFFFQHANVWLGKSAEPAPPASRQVAYLASKTDLVFIGDFVSAVPLLGCTYHAPGFLQHESPPVRTVESLHEDRDTHDRILLGKRGPTGDDDSDHESWETSQEEFKTEALAGSFCSFQSCSKPVRLVQRIANMGEACFPIRTNISTTSLQEAKTTPQERSLHTFWRSSTASRQRHAP